MNKEQAEKLASLINLLSFGIFILGVVVGLKLPEYFPNIKSLDTILVIISAFLIYLVGAKSRRLGRY